MNIHIPKNTTHKIDKSSITKEEYFKWRQVERRNKITASIIRIIQICYQAGIKDHDAIQYEVTRILQLPKCHQEEDAKLIDYLVPEIVEDTLLRLDILHIDLIDPFTRKSMNQKL